LPERRSGSKIFAGTAFHRVPAPPHPWTRQNCFVASRRVERCDRQTEPVFFRLDVDHSETDQSDGVNSNMAANDASSPLAAALEKRHMTVARVLLIGGCENRAMLSDWLLDVQARSGPWADDNAEHVDWLDRFAHAPSELGHLCRLVIRRVLGARVRESTCQLPVPKQLQEYILMNELLPAQHLTN